MTGRCGHPLTGHRREAVGLCAACYRRWADHGYPVGGVPQPARGAGEKAGRGGRVEDYQFLRERGLSRAEAALRLGVTRRTLERYEAALKDRTAA